MSLKQFFKSTCEGFMSLPFVVKVAIIWLSILVLTLTYLAPFVMGLVGCVISVAASIVIIIRYLVEGS